MSRQKRRGKNEPKLEIEKTDFLKVVNKLQTKDKPKYQKATITDPISHHVIPIKVKGTDSEDTKVPIKYIKDPSQVMHTTFDMDVEYSSSYKPHSRTSWALIFSKFIITHV